MLWSGKQLHQQSSLKEGQSMITGSRNHYRPGQSFGTSKLGTSYLKFCIRKKNIFLYKFKEVWQLVTTGNCLTCSPAHFNLSWPQILKVLVCSCYICANTALAKVLKLKHLSFFSVVSIAAQRHSSSRR